nr:hypothetical protein GCM10020241_05440 [Streptoalloteichus tenebrarius]
MAPYVGYVHVKDYRTTDGGRSFCPAGEGVVPYEMVLPLLHTARPALPYALETHVRDTPADALAARTARSLGWMVGSCAHYRSRRSVSSAVFTASARACLWAVESVPAPSPDAASTASSFCLWALVMRACEGGWFRTSRAA